MYDVPELRQPRRKALYRECSNINSSVNWFVTNKNTPAQKPIHIGQWKKWCLGLILLKIDP
jgi:hypothetical protein